MIRKLTMIGIHEIGYEIWKGEKIGLENMKLLVTGGAGFMGSDFIHYWIKKYPRDEVICLDKLTYAGNLENLESVEGVKNFHFVKGDIIDFELVDKLTKKIDTIVHFAAETHVDRSIMGPLSFVQTNILGTQVLLQAALKNKIKRFHQISTDEVFGALELNSKQKFNETSCFRPNSPYAASKAGSDCLTRAYGKTYNLPVTISHSSNNYGPYQFPEKFIPLAITNILEGKKVPVYGDGLYVRDWLFVRDHSQAIELILQKGKAGETYCLGGLTNDINNLTVIKMILKIMGVAEDMIKLVKDRPAHDRRYAIDWSKIKNELNWQPRYDFDAGLRKTIKWYKDNQAWWKRVKNGQYQEYYQKQYGRKQD